MVRPHAQYAHGAFLLEDFVDETVLDVDTARTGPVKIYYEFLVGRWVLKWVDGQTPREALRSSLSAQPPRASSHPSVHAWRRRRPTSPNSHLCTLAQRLTAYHRPGSGGLPLGRRLRGLGRVRPHPRSLEVCKHALLTGGAWLVRLLAAWGGVPTRRHSSDRRHLVSCLHTPSRMCIRMCIFLLQCSHWGGHGCSTRNSVGASA